MSEVETALLGALRDLQHPGDFDRTAEVRQTDAELSWTGSVSSRRHRILLLTFTRRAAEEMIRRVKRITATALGSRGRDASRWFGLRQCQDQTDNIMKLGIVLPYSSADMSLPIDRVLEAERLGFDSVWTSEAYGSDAVTPAAWVLARTTRIKVGTAIMQMPARTPAMTAMTAMTLDALSGGRFVLGIGPSGPQVVEGWHGVAYGKPLLRTREYIEIIRKILERNEPLTYAGEYYQIPFAGPGSTGLGKPLKSIMQRQSKDEDIYGLYRTSEHPQFRRGSGWHVP